MKTRIFWHLNEQVLRAPPIEGVNDFHQPPCLWSLQRLCSQQPMEQHPEACRQRAQKHIFSRREHCVSCSRAADSSIFDALQRQGQQGAKHPHIQTESYLTLVTTTC